MSKLKFGFQILFIAFVFVLVARMCWMVSRTEMGWRSILAHWRDGAAGLVAVEHDPVNFREPEAQAEYWLTRVDRFEAEQPESAEIAMACALLLDAPTPGFTFRHHRGRLIDGLNYSSIADAEDRFKNMTRQRCLELARRATELEPDNVLWWRLRAMLLWSDSLYRRDEEIRDVHWMDVLAECARHDPENALYDFIGAYHCWRLSSKTKYQNFKEHWIAVDPVGMRRGNEYFKRALTKSHVALGDESYRIVAELLSTTMLTPEEQHGVVTGQRLDLKLSLMFSDLYRSKLDRAQHAVKEGDALTAIRHFEQSLSMVDRFRDPNRPWSMRSFDGVFLLSIIDQIREITTTRPELTEHVDLRELDELEMQTRIEHHVRMAASEDLFGKPTIQMTSVRMDFQDSTLEMVSELAISRLPQTVIVLTLLFGVALGLTRCSRQPREKRVGLIGHIVAMLISISLAVVVFGLAPAEWISRESQEHTLQFAILLVAASPVLAIMIIAGRSFRRRSYRITMRDALILVLIVCAMCAIMVPAISVIDDWPHLMPRKSMPALEYGSIDPETMRESLGEERRWLTWVFQFDAYHGHLIMIAIWAAVALLILLIKSHVYRDNPLRVKWRTIAADFGHSLCRPAMAMCVLAFIIYLAITPTSVKKVDDAFQNNMEFSRYPESRRATFVEAEQRIYNDEKKMEEIRARAVTTMGSRGF